MKTRNLDELREKLPPNWTLDELILRLVAENDNLQIAYYPPDANEGTPLNGSDLSRITISLTIGPEHLYIMDIYNDGRISFVERKDFDPLYEIYFMFKQGDFVLERFFKEYAEITGYQNLTIDDFKEKVELEIFKPIKALGEVIIRNDKKINDVVNTIVDDDLLKAFIDMEIKPKLLQLLK